MRMKTFCLVILCSLLMAASWSEGFTLNTKPEFELKVTDYSLRQFTLTNALFDRHHITLYRGGMKLEVPMKEIASIKVIDWQVGTPKVEVHLKDATVGEFEMTDSVHVTAESPFGALEGTFDDSFPRNLQEIQFMSPGEAVEPAS